MDIKTFPAIPEALLLDLERRFPVRNARPGRQMDELMFEGGQRDVVGLLRRAFDEQNETILAPEGPHVHPEDPEDDA